jgi:hypothetical protein
MRRFEKTLTENPVLICRIFLFQQSDHFVEYHLIRKLDIYVKVYREGCEEMYLNDLAG